MLELVPDRSGVRIARGMIAATALSALMWTALVAVPLIAS